MSLGNKKRIYTILTNTEVKTLDRICKNKNISRSCLLRLSLKMFEIVDSNPEEFKKKYLDIQKLITDKK